MAFYHGQKRKHHYAVDLINTRTGFVSSTALAEFTTKKEALRFANNSNKVSAINGYSRFARVRKVSHDGLKRK